eukprot:402219_1
MVDDIDDGCSVGALGAGLVRSGDHGVQAFDVYRGAIVHVLLPVEVSYPDLSEVPRVVLVDQDAVVIGKTGVPPPGRVLPVFAHAPVASAHVPALLPVLFEAGGHEEQGGRSIKRDGKETL